MKVKLGPANLREGEMRSFEIDKRNVLVCKLGGRYKSIDDWCNHAGCLLSGGWLEGNMVVCPCHEIGFDLDTGKNLTSPSIADDQRAFVTTIEGGDIFIDGFEPEA